MQLALVLTSTIQFHKIQTKHIPHSSRDTEVMHIQHIQLYAEAMKTECSHIAEFTQIYDIDITAKLCKKYCMS